MGVTRTTHLHLGGTPGFASSPQPGTTGLCCARLPIAFGLWLPVIGTVRSARSAGPIRRVRDDNNPGVAAARLPRLRVRRSAWSTAHQQLLESKPVRALHFQDLRRARCPSHKRYRRTPNAESRSYRSHGGRSGLTVDSAFADTHHQHASVLATHPRASRPGPNPNSDPHQVSVTLASAELTLMAASRAGPQNHRGADSKGITERACARFHKASPRRRAHPLAGRVPGRSARRSTGVTVLGSRKSAGGRQRRGKRKVVDVDPGHGMVFFESGLRFLRRARIRCAACR
jgi:hypothetical protein